MRISICLVVLMLSGVNHVRSQDCITYSGVRACVGGEWMSIERVLLKADASVSGPVADGENAIYRIKSRATTKLGATVGSDGRVISLSVTCETETGKQLKRFIDKLFMLLNNEQAFASKPVTIELEEIVRPESRSREIRIRTGEKGVVRTLYISSFEFSDAPIEKHRTIMGLSLR